MEARGDDSEGIERRLEMDRKWFDKSTFDFHIDLVMLEMKPCWTPEEFAEIIMAHISAKERTNN